MKETTLLLKRRCEWSDNEAKETLVDTDHELDFSASSAPESWYEAAALAPKGDDRPWSRPGPITTMPSGRSIDLPMAALTALAMSIVGGCAWYAVDSAGVVTTPWLAVVLGAMIAIGVRLGGGGHDREAGAALAGLFYAVTLLVVNFLAARHSYLDLYGPSSNLVAFEQEVIRSRLTNPWAILAWFSGAAVTVKLSLLLGRDY
jgi:hypothetical protein